MIDFIDEICVFSKGEEEHDNPFRSVLCILERQSLYVKIYNYEFWVKSVAFFCPVVSKEGVRVDSKRLNWLRIGYDLAR